MASENRIPFSNIFSKLNNNGVPLNGTWLIVGLSIYTHYQVSLILLT